MRKYFIFNLVLEIVKCVLCGRESSKPVCEICTKQIIMDYPFLIRRGLAVGDFEGNLEDEPEILFEKDIEKLNEMAKNALMGRDSNFLLLSRYAILFHERFSDILKNFEIEENYYLNLAKEFASRSEDSESKYLLAKIYMEEDDPEGAEKVMETIWKEKREYALLYGRSLVASGKWGRAIEIYNEMLGENKDDKEVWKLLAEALYSSGNYEDAERAYLRVLQMDKDDYEAWYLRGLCLKNMNKWGGALQSFQTAVRKNPKYKEAYEEILNILVERGMYSRALETLKKMKEEGFDVDERMKEIEGRMKGWTL